MSNIALLPTWSVQCAEGRARAAQAIGDLTKTGDTPAFRKESESILAMAPGVVAGFWACLADRLA